MLKCFFVLTTAAALSAAPYTIEVLPTLAPNVFGSPSFTTWQANAITALVNGTTSEGNPSLPTYYQGITSAPASWAIVTGFPSWNGKANPGSEFGPAFASELGRRITFGVRILGDGSQQFAISDLSFSAASDDPANFLGFGFAAGGYNYSTAYQGLDYGADRMRGTADDVWVTSGPNTRLVDAIFGRGSGNSGAAYCPGCSIAQQQGQIDLAAAYAPYNFTGTYTLGGVSGSSTFSAEAVPEPATLSLLGSALAGLLLYKKRAS